MKVQKITAISAAVLALPMLLTGCGNDKDPSLPATPTVAAEGMSALAPEDFNSELMAAYKAFIQDGWDTGKAVVIKSAPKDEAPVTTSLTINPDGAMTGQTATMKKFCTEFQNCYQSADKGATWQKDIPQNIVRDADSLTMVYLANVPAYVRNPGVKLTAGGGAFEISDEANGYTAQYVFNREDQKLLVLEKANGVQQLTAYTYTDAAPLEAPGNLPQ